MEQEAKEAARHKAYEDKKLDHVYHEAVAQAFYSLSPEKRDLLAGYSR
jgi:hypothetical protein